MREYLYIYKKLLSLYSNKKERECRLEQKKRRRGAKL
jgi:hypothetical protein